MAPTKSRLTLARAAIRPAMRGKVMLSGPAGAGKTYTALVIAETLALADDPILHIDTEKESALTYADGFQFEHLRWAPPFDPRELQDTLIDASGKYGVVVIDSFSHFWRGSGGVLDIANGRFTGWKDARPAQVDVVEAILECDAHVIVCCRSKMDHVQEELPGGKKVVTKLGMAAIQDDDLEYEVNVAIEMDMQHVLHVGKSRTNAIPVGRQFGAGHAPEFASLYRDWLKGGEPVAPREQVAALVASLDTITPQSERVKAKQMFLEFFGRPEFLLISRMPEAAGWVAEQVTAATGGPVTGAATSGPEGVAGPVAVPDVPETPHTVPDVETPPDPPVDPPAPAQAPATAPQDAEDGGSATTGPNGPPAASETIYGGLAAERVEHFREAVAKYKISQVRSQLETAGVTPNGTPAQLRERLVRHLCAQAASAAA